MVDSKSPPEQGSAEDRPATVSNAPYEAPLTKAFDKLTSEIFIFLLAYVILLIGVAVFGSQLADTLRNLLYVIPVLGVMASVWLQQNGIVKKAKEKGINVRAGIVSDSARVAAVRGAKAGSDLPKNVDVGVGLAKDNAQVDGVVYGRREPDSPQSSSWELLEDVFKQLNKSNQIKLISSAQNLLDKEEKPHA